jgi:hypothetical protein
VWQYKRLFLEKFDDRISKCVNENMKEVVEKENNLSGGWILGIISLGLILRHFFYLVVSLLVIFIYYFIISFF